MADDALRLLILARDQSSRVQTALADLQIVLARMKGMKVVGVSTTQDPGPEREEAELAIVLGGDGAILRACRLFGTHQLPILGINLGRLGFLTDLSWKELEQNLSHVRDRKFNIVEHLMFECEHCHADGTSETYLGLNEVVIASAGSLKMLDVELAIGDEQVTTYSGDGLIISTPVGSTAHSLSAGGPILRQDLQAFVVTPICPHTLTNRPLVDRADVEYAMTVPHVDEGVMLVIDGQIKEPVRPKDRVIVRRAAVTFQLAKLPSHSYYSVLHRKLGWSGQPRYRRPRS
ncbi:MAG: NAD(+)/NADH kinase [Planctomycetaceae bacterium]|nr:NAD(+)/NADH kinase [Planctomycetaceae bacterium]